MHPRNEQFFTLNNSTPRDDEAIRQFYASERAELDRQARALFALLAFCVIGWTAVIVWLVLR